MSSLKNLLAASEAEVERLRKLLGEQKLLTKEVCEAAERSTGEARAAAESAEEIKRLQALLGKLQQEKSDMEKEQMKKDLQNVEMQQKAAMAMAAAEKVLTMHAAQLKRIEQLRLAKLGEAIQHKVELHISVPRVTLSYNNAPPLPVSAAAALSEEKISQFLNAEVFPQFEPLWTTLDNLDEAPDGTTKKVYSTRMLERLTEAVKGFVEKSQRGEEGGLTPCVREPISGSTGTVEVRPGTCSSKSKTGDLRPGTSSAKSSAESRPGTSGGLLAKFQANRPGTSSAGTGSRSPSTAAGSNIVANRPVTSPRSGLDSTSLVTDGVPSPSRPRASTDGTTKGGKEAIAEADRQKLLGLLRSGDDRGLDDTLKELLNS